MRVALATCHSIATINGVLVGHPNDLKQFEAVKFAFQEISLRPASRPYPAELAMVRPMSVFKSSADDCAKDVPSGDSTKSSTTFEIGILLMYPFSAHLRVWMHFTVLSRYLVFFFSYIIRHHVNSRT